MLNKPNPNKIHRANGIGFWMNADGSRSAEYFGKIFTFKRNSLGSWEGHGRCFRTLGDAAEFVADSH